MEATKTRAYLIVLCLLNKEIILSDVLTKEIFSPTV